VALTRARSLLEEEAESNLRWPSFRLCIIIHRFLDFVVASSNGLEPRSRSNLSSALPTSDDSALSETRLLNLKLAK
jgi:hypothetical protein